MGYTLERRIRLSTMRFDIGHRPSDIYRDVDPDAVLALLMHKAMKAASVEGIPSARDLVADWLVNCVSRYTANMYERQGVIIPDDFATDDVLVDLDAFPQLQVIPRLVYALLRSPLLPYTARDGTGIQIQTKQAADGPMPAVAGPMGDVVGVNGSPPPFTGAPPTSGFDPSHPDLRPFILSLWCALPPHELTRAVYPVLESWASLSEIAHDRLLLSRGTVEEEQEEVAAFLLDTFYALLLVYSEAGAAGMPWPPPPDAPLARHMQAVKASRSITPRTQLLGYEGDPCDDPRLVRMLIEEPAEGWVSRESPTLADAALGGYPLFVEVLAKEAFDYIRSGEVYS